MVWFVSLSVFNGGQAQAWCLRLSVEPPCHGVCRSIVFVTPSVQRLAQIIFLLIEYKRWAVLQTGFRPLEGYFNNMFCCLRSALGLRDSAHAGINDEQNDKKSRLTRIRNPTNECLDYYHS